MKLKRTLAVTSPPMKGEDVEHAQRMLNSTAPSSRFGNFRPGAVDGVFGSATAQATQRAKYWLGYAEKDITPTYGQMLEDFLGGDKDLPSAYKTRRAARLKKSQEKPLRVKAYLRALAELKLGVKESPPNSNKVKYTRWYGLTGPWCAMFVTWCYVGAGSLNAFRKGQRFAYTPYMVQDARDRDWTLRPLSKDEVKQGDIVMFDWGGGGMGKSPYLTDHTGLFEKWTNKSKGMFTTIEGNTAVGNDSNGGSVMRRNRTLPQVSAFIRAET
jgi:hypothetical protein